VDSISCVTYVGFKLYVYQCLMIFFMCITIEFSKFILHTGSFYSMLLRHCHV
jgi:hypothetical protein